MAFIKLKRGERWTLLNLDHIALMLQTAAGGLVQLKCCREVNVTAEEFEAIERLLDVANRRQAEMSHSLREAYAFVKAVSESGADVPNRSKIFVNPNLTRRSPAEAPKEPPVQDLPGMDVWKSYLVVDPSDVVDYRIMNAWGSMEKVNDPLPLKVEAKDAEKGESPEAKAALDAVINDPSVWLLCSQESHVTGACSDCDKLTVLRGWNNLAKGRRDLCRECETKLFGGRVYP